MNNIPTKNMFLSNISRSSEQKTAQKPAENKQEVKVQNTQPTKTAKDVIGKRPTKRYNNPYIRIKNTDGLNNVELNGVNLSGKISAAQMEKIKAQKEQTAKQQPKQNQPKQSSRQPQNKQKQSNSKSNMQSKQNANANLNASVNTISNANANANSNAGVSANANTSLQTVANIASDSVMVSQTPRRTTYSTDTYALKRQAPRKLNLFEKIDAEQSKKQVEIIPLYEKQTEQTYKSKNKNSLKVIFLGGVCEVGKNMMALEYGRDIIIIDCGSIFPYNDFMPGIDLVVPEITYLVQNKERIRGIVITHGHEDHIGSMPYVLNEINAPVWASKLTVALIQNKLREFPNIKAKFNTVKAGDSVNIGCFNVEFINVNHSIPDSCALAITTPAGLMVHTGDFKVDFNCVNEQTTDLARFAELGKKGVMLLTCESTNIEREGHSLSESQVAKKLDELFERFEDDRIFVATFASNVHRLQSLLSLAEKYKRKVTFTGRSMQNVTEIAYKLGELKFDPKIFIDIDDISKYQDKEILVITTGSQGEPMSALTRMASNEFPKIKLGEHDAVIFSSHPIPGNEKAVNNIVNALYRLGCKVIYSSLESVHASGHAYQEEIKLIHSLVRPKYFIPVHGEFRHLTLHKELAVKMGTEARNVVVPDIGNVVEVNSRSIKIAGNIPAGERLVDGLGLGESDSSVLRDRRQMSEDGVAVAVVCVDTKAHIITSGPDIISRGLIYSNEMDALIKEGKQALKELISNYLKDQDEIDISDLKTVIKKALANFFFKKTKRRPMSLAVVIEE